MSRVVVSRGLGGVGEGGDRESGLSAVGLEVKGCRRRWGLGKRGCSLPAVAGAGCWDCFFFFLF